MRPRNQTIAVGDFSWVMPSGTVPDQPGPVMRKLLAAPLVVRERGTWNRSVQPECIGGRK
jgi:hypothetical protein